MKQNLILVFFLCISLITYAQEFTPNYNEAKIPDFTLAALLESTQGKKITSTDDWESIRRPEILEIFKGEVYGNIPDAKVKTSYKSLESSTEAIDGKAIRKQVRITFKRKGKSAFMDLLIYLPKQVGKPVPIFVGPNFYGNHAIENDPEILLSNSWMRNNEGMGITDHKATEKSRGYNSHRWPVSYIIENGFGVATYYYGDIDPDFDDGFKNGIHALFNNKKNNDVPKADAWGSIAAWAWGLSRAMDYFETDSAIDEARVAVLGHSRLGKAALCAAAYDERFALVISNESGCGGAALSKRAYGETVGRINRVFPHWFCDNYNKYNENEAALPIDQHGLLALVAPRPLYVASAEEDQWADPKGEFLSLKTASIVYELYGLENLIAAKMPPVDQPLIQGHTGYHIRTGKHNVLKYDWEQFVKFAEMHLE